MDEHKTAPPENRLPYTAPRAIRLDDLHSGAGANCNVGSGVAAGLCKTGGGAGIDCRTGNGARVPCNKGNGFH